MKAMRLPLEATGWVAVDKRGNVPRQYRKSGGAGGVGACPCVYYFATSITPPYRAVRVKVTIEEE
jgi:hypothetical protein